jgi:hypothetical protein
VGVVYLVRSAEFVGRGAKQRAVAYARRTGGSVEVIRGKFLKPKGRVTNVQVDS